VSFRHVGESKFLATPTQITIATKGDTFEIVVGNSISHDQGS